MSKLTALITTLVLGASSVAMASPASSFRPARDDASWVHRNASYERRVDRSVDRGRSLDRADRRWRDDGVAHEDGARRYRASWVALASVQLDGSREAIRVADPGTFTQLRLQTETGASRIDRVVIRFRDGGSQIVEPDRVLNSRSAMFEIPLDGNNRRIDRIIVEGDSARRGELQVFAI